MTDEIKIKLKDGEVILKKPSRLSKLVGEPLTVTIGGEEFTLKPLTIKDLPLLMSMNDPSLQVRNDAMINMISETLKQCVPDATIEEINKVGLTYFREFSEAIMKVNGLDDDLEKSKPIKE